MIQSFLSDVNVLKSLPSIENNTKEFIYTILMIIMKKKILLLI